MTSENIKLMCAILMRVRACLEYDEYSVSYHTGESLVLSGLSADQVNQLDNIIHILIKKTGI
jgi:hypothetical protein